MAMEMEGTPRMVQSHRIMQLFGCGSTTRHHNGTLVSGNMDQHLRNLSCLIWSHCHLWVNRKTPRWISDLDFDPWLLGQRHPRGGARGARPRGTNWSSWAWSVAVVFVGLPCLSGIRGTDLIFFSFFLVAKATKNPVFPKKGSFFVSPGSLNN